MSKQFYIQFYFKEFSLALLHSLNAKNSQLKKPQFQMLPLQARLDLGAMAMKEYSAFSKVPASYPGHSLGGVLPLCREAVGVFYSLSRLGNTSNVINTHVSVDRLKLYIEVQKQKAENLGKKS